MRATKYQKPKTFKCNLNCRASLLQNSTESYAYL